MATSHLIFFLLLVTPNFVTLLPWFHVPTRNFCLSWASPHAVSYIFPVWTSFCFVLPIFFMIQCYLFAHGAVRLQKRLGPSLCYTQYLKCFKLTRIGRISAVISGVTHGYTRYKETITPILQSIWVHLKSINTVESLARGKLCMALLENWTLVHSINLEAILSLSISSSVLQLHCADLVPLQLALGISFNTLFTSSSWSVNKMLNKPACNTSLSSKPSSTSLIHYCLSLSFVYNSGSFHPNQSIYPDNYESHIS